MSDSGDTILYSQPILVGREVGGSQMNGGGYLAVINVSDRTIKINHEILDINGNLLADGYDNVEPGRGMESSALIGGGDPERRLMYGKIWFTGSEDDIRASFIMKIIEGTSGNEIYTPVYAVSFKKYNSVPNPPENLSIA